VIFILSVVIVTLLELQLMAAAEGLCHIFEWGREMKKVGLNYKTHYTSLNFRIYVTDFDPASYRLESISQHR